MQRCLRGQGGQGLIEYGLILVIVSVAVIIFLMLLGQNVTNLFSNITVALASH
jgi:Flp pilus assembly pilin Flp